MNRRTVRCVIASLVVVLFTAMPAAGLGENPDAHAFPLVQMGPGLSLHKEMFVLPATYSSTYPREQSEIIFQLSAKHRLFGTRIYFAYTIFPATMV